MLKMTARTTASSTVFLPLASGKAPMLNIRTTPKPQFLEGKTVECLNGICLKRRIAPLVDGTWCAVSGYPIHIYSYDRVGNARTMFPPKNGVSH